MKESLRVLEMTSLWNLNTPENFWLCQPLIPQHFWQEAIQKSKSLLGLDGNLEIDEVLALTLGEDRFGADHWRLSSFTRLYYLIKPLLPRSLTRILRRFYRGVSRNELDPNWPIDARFALFQWEVLRRVLVATNRDSISYKCLWPKNYRYAFTLTHDVETARGQEFVRKVADLEENLGFKSSFNFVLERYPLDFGLIRELVERGFEVGCHGLKHDGKLFSTKMEFARRVIKINAYMKEYGMVGFRSPLTHRNPEWMQMLDIEYDLSFFDTDPFEPIPGGTMGIWPFFLGHFLELPYTLVQDYTLTSILGETTPRIWLEKVDFIKQFHGMALVNSHPDYLKEKRTWDVYDGFLNAMKNRDGYWHALPREIARWWRKRAVTDSTQSMDQDELVNARLRNGQVFLDERDD
jgi:peptidoglycan/xylan/chitin deacetylase (PgdA/CDA1 family)